MKNDNTKINRTEFEMEKIIHRHRVLQRKRQIQLDKDFYERNPNTGQKIPTWFGVDFKAGYEINKGQFISEEHATPGSGLWYAGVDIPLGQGLLFDERRSTILQAKIFQKNSENEQKLIINLKSRANTHTPREAITVGFI